jgi:hypothetical protein
MVPQQYNTVWPKNNMVPSQYNTVWPQNNMVPPQYNTVWPQNNMVWHIIWYHYTIIQYGYKIICYS